MGPAAGGYRLTLHVDAPTRASLPLLAADGVPLGVAKQSPDRRTMTMLVTDPEVPSARDVRLVWSSDLGKETAGRSRGQAAGPSATAWCWSTTMTETTVPGCGLHGG